MRVEIRPPDIRTYVALPTFVFAHALPQMRLDISIPILSFMCHAFVSICAYALYMHMFLYMHVSPLQPFNLHLQAFIQFIPRIALHVDAICRQMLGYTVGSAKPEATWLWLNN